MFTPSNTRHPRRVLRWPGRYGDLQPRLHKPAHFGNGARDPPRVFILCLMNGYDESPSPPSYRRRLRVEGWTLAASGAAGTAALLASVPDDATANPASTAVQLGVVAVLLAWLGPRSVRRAIGAATAPPAGEPLSGEPTPLWQLPCIVAVLATPFAVLGVWDASLRVTLGCVLVGLTQAVVLERIVAARERSSGDRYVRLPGSRILRGTRLGSLRPARSARAHDRAPAPVARRR